MNNQFKSGSNQTALAEMERELSAVSAAIGSVRFMDQPDGGDVSLAEQVSRMRQALTAAESELARARKALKPFAVVGASMNGAWLDHETHWPLSGRKPTITVGHLRAASRAISPDGEERS